MLGGSKQLRMWVGYHSQTYADYISGWKLLLPVSTPLWCKQDVGPRGLRQRLLCNWFSLQQEAGRGGERLVFLPVSNPPPSSAPPPPPSPCTRYTLSLNLRKPGHCLGATSCGNGGEGEEGVSRNGRQKRSGLAVGRDYGFVWMYTHTHGAPLHGLSLVFWFIAVAFSFGFLWGVIDIQSASCGSSEILTIWNIAYLTNTHFSMI